MGIFDFLKKKPAVAQHEELDLPPEPPKLGEHSEMPALPVNEELHPLRMEQPHAEIHKPTLHPPKHAPPGHKSKGKPVFPPLPDMDNDLPSLEDMHAPGGLKSKRDLGLEAGAPDLPPLPKLPTHHDMPAKSQHHDMPAIPQHLDVPPISVHSEEHLGRPPIPKLPKHYDMPPMPKHAQHHLDLPPLPKIPTHHDTSSGPESDHDKLPPIPEHAREPEHDELPPIPSQVPAAHHADASVAVHEEASNHGTVEGDARYLTVDEFKLILGDIHQAKEDIKDIHQYITDIVGFLDEEARDYGQFGHSLMDIHKKLTFVDKTLFKSA